LPGAGCKSMLIVFGRTVVMEYLVYHACLESREERAILRGKEFFRLANH